MIQYPEDEDILDAVGQLGLKSRPILVMRDLARLVELLQLSRRGFLDRLAVAGGMAMRCYGSTRFTMADLDTSAVITPVDREDLEDALNYEDDSIVIKVGTRKWWEEKKRLFTAAPIDFRFLRSRIQVEDQDRRFSLTVSERGLLLQAVELELRNIYQFDLGLDGRRIPVMDKVEICAEKTLGAAVFGIAKHYADVAYLALHYTEELQKRREELRSVLADKLKAGKKLFPAEYASFPEVASLRTPLMKPDQRHPKMANDWEATVRFLGGEPITFENAVQIINEIYVPLLFSREV